MALKERHSLHTPSMPDCFAPSSDTTQLGGALASFTLDLMDHSKSSSWECQSARLLLFLSHRRTTSVPDPKQQDSHHKDRPFNEPQGVWAGDEEDQQELQVSPLHTLHLSSTLIFFIDPIPVSSHYNWQLLGCVLCILRVDVRKLGVPQLLFFYNRYFYCTVYCSFEGSWEKSQSVWTATVFCFLRNWIRMQLPDFKKIKFLVLMNAIILKKVRILILLAV